MLLLVPRQPLAIPRRAMRIALGMGVAYAVMLYDYLGAVNYLPVNRRWPGTCQCLSTAAGSDYRTLSRIAGSACR